MPYDSTLVIENELEDIQFRFRTITDFNHGTLPPFNVKLEGFKGKPRDVIIICTIYHKEVINNKTIIDPHPNRLVISAGGNQIKCMDPIESKLNNELKATFNRLIIIKTKDKEDNIRENIVEKLVKIQKYKHNYMNRNELENINLNKFDMKNIQLCFEAFIQINDKFEAICDPVFSKNIKYSTKPMKSISWYCENCFGQPSGNDRMIIVYDFPKDVIKKGDIKVRFFDKISSWEKYAEIVEYISFCPHSFIIATPPYVNEEIATRREVSFELSADNFLPISKTFTYNASFNAQKRKRKAERKEMDDYIDLITMNMPDEERKKCQTADDLVANTPLEDLLPLSKWDNLTTDGKSVPKNRGQTMSTNKQNKTTDKASTNKLSDLKLLKELKIKNILHKIIEDNDESKLNDLLQVIEKYNIKQILKLQNKNGDTCLHIACYFNRVELIDKILNTGIDPNIQNNNGDTPLHIAVGKKYKECITKILDNQYFKILKNIDLTNDKGYTVLYLSVLSKEYEITKQLIERGNACAEFVNPTNGNNILHLAVMQINSSNKIKTKYLIDYLIENTSFDVDAENHLNLTPLAMAIEIGDDAADLRI